MFVLHFFSFTILFLAFSFFQNMPQTFAMKKMAANQGTKGMSMHELKVGELAPEFPSNIMDEHGKEMHLKDFAGKVVVLEWMSPGCPFVQAQYEKGSATNPIEPWMGNMQNLQKKYTEKGVVWLSISSSAPGKEGYLTPEVIKNTVRGSMKSMASFIVMDPMGSVGKLYGAKSTPHLFVINKEGKLAYQGAIDDNATTEASEIKKSHNYIVPILDAALENRHISSSEMKTSTQSYGCSIKY